MIGDLLLASSIDAPRGDVVFTTAGSFEWTCPENVYSVCVVAVGATMNRGAYLMNTPGSGLGWKNNIPVVPGTKYVGQVGSRTATTPTSVGASVNKKSSGGDSFFIDRTTVCGFTGGWSGSSGTTARPGGWNGDGGGNGGAGGGAAGGAGGYTGNGGGADGTPSSGGGGGAGGAGVLSGDDITWSSRYANGGGGGVGIYGQGVSGSSGANGYDDGSGQTLAGQGGKGGSGGTDGGTPPGDGFAAGGNAGQFGGGLGKGYSYDNYETGVSNNKSPGTGSDGVVRILWGDGRAFPSTNVSTSTN